MTIKKTVKKCANFKEEISYDEGLLFRGTKLIVQTAEISKFIKNVHAGYVGIYSSLARAR